MGSETAEITYTDMIFNIGEHRCQPVWITVSCATMQNSAGSVSITLNSAGHMPLCTGQHIASQKNGRKSKENIYSRKCKL